MNLLRLHDPLLAVLFENEEIIAVDKPAGIDSHTNESKTGNEEFIQPGLIEIYERQLNTKLHIVHRLDRTTTGAIVFGKSLESAKKYQQYFRNRETQKTYVFVTASRSDKSHLKSDQVIIHKGAELEASTDFKKIKTYGRFDLWEAYPHTGRNHQIRIHAQGLDISLLGDEKYGGANFSFLCLHNRKIVFPNGVVIESKLPVYFDDLSLLEDRVIATALFDVDRRRRLFGEASFKEALRFANPKFGDERAIAIDQLGDVLALTWPKDHWSAQEDRVFGDLATKMNKPILVRMTSSHMKEKSGKHRQAYFSSGDEDVPQTWIAVENGINFEMRSDSGQFLGLSLDQRLQRNWLRENSKDKRVLDLFSQSGGFALSAAVGGASEVTLVDSGKTALNWSRKNFDLNGLGAENEKIKFFCRDAKAFLEQSKSKNQLFDTIVCDPPSFSRGEKGVFKIEAEIESLLAMCLSRVAPGGHLLFSTSFENFFVDDLRKLFLKLQSSLKLKLEISSLQPSLDFELPGERTATKSFFVKILN